MRFCALLLAGAALCVSSARAAEEVRAELRKVEGTWSLSKGEEGGKPLPEATMKRCTLTIVGVNHSLTFEDRVMLGTHRIDPTQEPKTITCRDSVGPYAGKTREGIYRLKDDTMEVSLSKPGEERPKDFSSKEGVHQIWKRQKAFDQSTAAQWRRFQGRWQLVSAVRDGQEMPKDAVEKTRLLVRGSGFALQMDGTAGESGAPHLGCFMLDSSKEPKNIDVTPLSGADQGKEMKGIYKIEGDLHVVCLAAPGEGRPTDFTSKSGSRRLLETWKRQPRQGAGRASE